MAVPSIELIFSAPCPIKRSMNTSISTSNGTAKKFLCLCSACGKDFGGVRAFDLHRVGKHEYDYNPDHPDGRRCLSEQEMLARGMYLNESGRWSQPRNGLSERLGSRTRGTELAILTS
jgi:hypothetical protein